MSEFIVGDEVTVTDLMVANGYPRLFDELRGRIGKVEEVTNNKRYRVTFGDSAFAPVSGYIMDALEIERAYTGPTILGLYRETMDEIRDGRNDPGDLMDALYRLVTHPKYSHNAFGLVASRLLKAHYNRLENDE